jgi:hypothetical protein
MAVVLVATVLTTVVAGVFRRGGAEDDALAIIVVAVVIVVVVAIDIWAARIVDGRRDAGAEGTGGIRGDGRFPPALDAGAVLRCIGAAEWRSTLPWRSEAAALDTAGRTTGTSGKCSCPTVVVALEFFRSSVEVATILDVRLVIDADVGFCSGACDVGTKSAMAQYGKVLSLLVFPLLLSFLFLFVFVFLLLLLSLMMMLLCAWTSS